MNKEVINLLEEYRKIANVLGSPYAEKAYRAAIDNIGNLDYKITLSNMESLKGIGGIGKSIFGKIEEFLRTGRNEELEKARTNPKIRAHRELSQVPGFGPRMVNKLIDMGLMNIKAVRMAVAVGRVTLTSAQKLGLDHYEDLVLRIPRDEVTAIYQDIEAAIKRVDTEARVEALGSYRRGLPSSGDVDLLVTNMNKFDEHLIENILVELRKGDREGTPGKIRGVFAQGSQKVSFLYKMRPNDSRCHVRQVDIFHAQPHEHIPYLLYATGSATHNEMIRGLCKRLGYRLNQTGLYKITKQGLMPVPLQHEEDLYKILGLDYVPPTERN